MGRGVFVFGILVRVTRPSASGIQSENVSNLRTVTSENQRRTCAWSSRPKIGRFVPGPALDAWAMAPWIGFELISRKSTLPPLRLRPVAGSA